jgi:hypothetical protein
MPVPRVEIIKGRREQPYDGSAGGARKNAEKRDDQTRENIYEQGIHFIGAF